MSSEAHETGWLGRALRIALVAMTLGYAPALAGAQNATIVMTTSAPRVMLGVPFDLEIRVDSAGSRIQGVEPPNLSSFEILGRSVSQPMQVSVGPGGTPRVQMSSVHSYRLRARQSGRIEIPPAIALIDGRRMPSNAVEIEVVDGPAGSVTGTTPSGAIPDPGQPPDAMEDAVVDPSLFVRVVAQPEDPFVGEQVTVSVLLYTRVATREVTSQVPVGTDGFWVQDLITPNQPAPARRRERVGGMTYDVHTIGYFAAFPLESGDLVLDAPRYAMTVGGSSFFGPPPQQVVREGLPVTVHVRPLPPGVPRDTVVGSYTLEARVDRDRVRTGDAVTLTATISGEGNLRDVQLALPTIPGVRALQPHREDELHMRGSRLGGARRVEWLLVPEQPGEIVIPALELSVFEPHTETARTLRTEPITLTVAGAPVVTPDVGPTPSTEPAGSSPEAAPIGAIRTRSELSRTSTPLSDRPLYWITMALFPALFGVSWALRRRRESRAAHASRADVLSANAVRVRLRDAKRAQEAADTAAFYAATAAAIRAALEGSLGESVGSLTHTQLRQRLEELGMQEDLRRRVVEELEGGDFARFSSEAGSFDEMTRSLQRAQVLVGRLTKFKPGTLASSEGAR